MRKTILIFGSLAAAIFILFELNKLSWWSMEEAPDVFIVLSGALFILIGFLMNRLLQNRTENRKPKALQQSYLTKQEHKVLVLMNDGLSNNEIAGRLFIAESTVKTHVSNILLKLKAKRRTEAVKIGRDLHII
ncbi:LuxR C-terminal-related transcriptional regulator [Flavobacteriaceae bacterium 3-367]